MVKNGLRYARVLALVLLVSAGVMGCSGEEKKETAAASKDPVPMKVIKAEVRNMPQWGEFVGQVSAKESVEVRARVAGFLQERKFDEGRQVKKGDLLFVIDPKPFQEDLKQAQAVVASNSALLTKSKKDYDRFKKLFDEGVVSRDEFESHQTERATYQAQLNDSRAKMENAKIQLGYTKIYAPIDGLISRVQVDVGNLVGQGENTLLATISSQDPIYVSFSVSENEYIRAVRDKSAKEAGRAIKMILSDGSEYEHPGAFDMIDPTIDAQTGSLGIRVVFDNPDNLLRPGQYAKIRVIITESQDAVVVPSVGVMDTQGMKSLYVVGEDGVVKNQPVKIGNESNNMVVIKEGLKEGDLVIVEGIRRVRPGMQIKPIVVPVTADGQTEAPAAAQAAEEKAE